MRAELTIEHASGDLVAALEAVLGQHNPAALAASALQQKSPASSGAITYSAVGPAFIVMAWPTPERLFLYVESSGGRLRRAAGDVWDVIRRGGSSLDPTIRSVVLFDEDANDEIATARVGLTANLERRELQYTIIVGVVTTAWLTVALAAFDATGDLVLGAVPALVATALASVALVADTKRQRLVWK